MDEIAFHSDAAEEMRAAAAYDEAPEQGLGDQFLDEVEVGLRRIQQFPPAMAHRRRRILAISLEAISIIVPVGIYNMVDDAPVRRQEYYHSLAVALGVTPAVLPPARAGIGTDPHRSYKRRSQRV
jgi:hypothetical protein